MYQRPREQIAPEPLDHPALKNIRARALALDRAHPEPGTLTGALPFSWGGATTTDTGSTTYKGKMVYLMHDGEVAPIIGGKNYDVQFYVGALANGNYYSGTLKAINMTDIEVELEDGSKQLRYDITWEGRGVFVRNGTMLTKLPTET